MFKSHSHSSWVLASHSLAESAGHILFNDNTLIPFNSIIAVSKWPRTPKVGVRDLKAAPSFTSSGNVSVIIPSAPLSATWGQRADFEIRSVFYISGEISSLSLQFPPPSVSANSHARRYLLKKNKKIKGGGGNQRATNAREGLRWCFICNSDIARAHLFRFFFYSLILSVTSMFASMSQYVIPGFSVSHPQH